MDTTRFNELTVSMVESAQGTATHPVKVHTGSGRYHTEESPYYVRTRADLYFVDAQRVAFRYKLEPFTSESTEAYIKHRLRLAGSPRLPFSSEAMLAIHKASGGTPRVINTLCDNLLFEGFIARQRELDEAIVDKVARDLDLTPPEAPAPPVRADPTRIDLADVDRYLDSLGGK